MPLTVRNEDAGLDTDLDEPVRPVIFSPNGCGARKDLTSDAGSSGEESDGALACSELADTDGSVSDSSHEKDVSENGNSSNDGESIQLSSRSDTRRPFSESLDSSSNNDSEYDIDSDHSSFHDPLEYSHWASASGVSFESSKTAPQEADDEASVLFPQFRRFPPELRARVWEYFCPDLATKARIFELGLTRCSDQQTYHVLFTRKLVAQTLASRQMMKICRDTRALALVKFPDRLWVDETMQKFVPFHKEKDVVFITSESFLFYGYKWRDEITPFTDVIRNLAFDVEPLLYPVDDPRKIRRCMRIFPNLQNVFLSAPGPPSYQPEHIAWYGSAKVHRYHFAFSSGDSYRFRLHESLFSWPDLVKNAEFARMHVNVSVKDVFRISKYYRVDFAGMIKNDRLCLKEGVEVWPMLRFSTNLTPGHYKFWSEWDGKSEVPVCFKSIGALGPEEEAKSHTGSDEEESDDDESHITERSDMDFSSDSELNVIDDVSDSYYTGYDEEDFMDNPRLDTPLFDHFYHYHPYFASFWGDMDLLNATHEEELHMDELSPDSDADSEIWPGSNRVETESDSGTESDSESESESGNDNEDESNGNEGRCEMSLQEDNGMMEQDEGSDSEAAITDSDLNLGWAGYSNSSSHIGELNRVAVVEETGMLNDPTGLEEHMYSFGDVINPDDADPVGETDDMGLHHMPQWFEESEQLDTNWGWGPDL